MSGEPFKTKFTIGLLTITPCPLDDPSTTVTDVEVKSPEVLAVEQAARDAIAKKKARKVLRSKSRSQSPNSKKNGTSVGRTRSGKKKPVSRSSSKETQEPLKEKENKEDLEAAAAAAAAAKKLAEEEEFERLKAEAERLQKEQEEAERLKAAQEEEARLKAAQEAEEQAALEAAAAALLAQPEEELLVEEESLAPLPQPIRTRPKRRISMFPACKANTGLTDAIKRYGNDTPFDWEKPEWTKEHVNLKHTSTINNTYGWQKPEWAQRNLLRKTERGDKLKQGQRLEGSITQINANRRPTLSRRHSMTGRSINIPSKGKVTWHKPLWARKSILRPTELGEAARLGFNLEVPVNIIKSLAAGDELELHQLEGSFASLNASQKNFGWEKPSWAIDPNLKSTETGMAVRQGANLALPVTELKVKGHASDSSGEGFVVSPHNSFAALSASQKNISWEKPSWAINTNLRRTSKGEKMKEVGNLAAPITRK